MAKTVLTFGPQHVVFPEPIQFKLKVEDEFVVGAEPVIGYVHRGIEKAFELNELKKNIFLAERICGICQSPHSTAYVLGVERLMGIDAPARARYIRVIINEMNRLHSHMLWFGLLGDAIGFESYFMQVWNYREKLMDVLEKITGNRVTYSMNAIGGVRRDISDELQKEINRVLDFLEEALKSVDGVLRDYTMVKRTKGVGVLTEKEAKRDGAVGPTARASNVPYDMRMLGYDAYCDLEFKPVVVDTCDSYGRAVVRWKEMFQSIELIRECLSKMPPGDIMTKSNALPKGECVIRVEPPRGELFYYLKGNGTKNLERVKVRTPTFANIWPTITMLTKGCEFANVPVIVLSIDPCISCTER
ncbi:MAG: nickel-dependent hydrogenase large subunit [Thermoplasmata archaeon]|nr:nickel-dependent hydrogenase large subunit [Thermoplasmata archaeon]